MKVTVPLLLVTLPEQVHSDSLVIVPSEELSSVLPFCFFAIARTCSSRAKSRQIERLLSFFLFPGLSTVTV